MEVQKTVCCHVLCLFFHFEWHLTVSIYFVQHGENITFKVRLSKPMPLFLIFLLTFFFSTYIFFVCCVPSRVKKQKQLNIANQTLKLTSDAKYR